jgi:phosphoglycerate dehydrogenase-like enzyme
LSDLSIGIIGYGGIGQEIARTAKFFNMKVYVTKRTILNVEDDVLDGVFDVDHLNEMMGKVDYLINITPSTEKTKKMLSNSKLKNCKKGCVFISIGRGNVIDEESILNALDSNWIDKAILDVFEVEPLPKESKLWKHEKVVITPHVSGVPFPKDISDVFIENLELYENNQQLKYVYNWDEGY